MDRLFLAGGRRFPISNRGFLLFLIRSKEGGGGEEEEEGWWCFTCAGSKNRAAVAEKPITNN